MKTICSQRELGHRAHREYGVAEMLLTTKTQSRSQNAIFGYRDRHHKDDVLAQSRRAAETVLTTKTQRHKDEIKKTTYKNSLKQYFAASRLRGENRSDENSSETSVAKTFLSHRVHERPFTTKTLRHKDGAKKEAFKITIGNPFVSLCLCGKHLGGESIGGVV